jgi:hypothetical protein
MFRKSDYLFLFAASASCVASISLWFLVSRESGVFVGLWVPSILSLWVGVRLAAQAHDTKLKSGSVN